MSNRQLFVLGAAKAGTTTLHNCLDQHPEICMSRPKEPVFFERDDRFSRGVEYYRNQFYEHCGEVSWYGDARQRNLYCPWVAERIHELFPRARLIVSLRDPVRRALSHYWHARRHGREKQSPAEAFERDFSRLDEGKTMESPEERSRYQETIKNNRGLYRTYLDSGHYYQQIERYLDYFDRQQIHVVVFERFTESPEETLRSLFQFLGVDPDVPVEVDRSNPGYVPRSSTLHRLFYYLGSTVLSSLIPERIRNWIKEWNRSGLDYGEVDSDLLARLRDHYSPRNEKLYEWLGKDLSDTWEMERDDYS